MARGEYISDEGTILLEVNAAAFGRGSTTVPKEGCGVERFAAGKSSPQGKSFGKNDRVPKTTIPGKGRSRLFRKGFQPPGGREACPPESARVAKPERGSGERRATLDFDGRQERSAFRPPF